MYIAEPRVLGDFMNQGVVIVYLKSEGSGITSVQALPYTAGIGYYFFTIVDAPGANIEGILVSADSIDNMTALPDLSDVQFRYVLIPAVYLQKCGITFLKITKQ